MITKENLKKNNAITLIALVITIIILLILATISIVALKDSNLFKNSQKAREQYIIADEKESITLAWNAETLKYDGDTSKIIKEDLEDELNNKQGRNTKVTEEKEPKEENGKPVFRILFIKTNHLYTIDRYTGKITGPNTTPDPIPSQDSSITIDMIASDITSTTITVTVTASGNEMANNPEYTYYLNGEQKGEATNNTTYTYIDLAPKTEYTLKVSTEDSQNVVGEKEITATTCKNGETINPTPQVGDIVMYTPPSGRSIDISNTNSGMSDYHNTKKYSGNNQTFNSENSAIITWKVWKVNKANNTIEIVSSNSTSTKLFLYGATGYNQGPGIINKICSTLYSNENKGITARSLDGLDLDEAIAEHRILTRGTDEWIYYIRSLAYDNSVNYPYGKTGITSEKVYVPNCYSEADITTEQANDLRPIETTASGCTQKSGFKRMITKYDISDIEVVAKALGSVRQSIIGKRNCLLSSRCVYGGTAYMSVLGLRTITNGELDSGLLIGSMYNDVPKLCGSNLSPMITTNSNTPITFLSTDEIGFNTWQIN